MRQQLQKAGTKGRGIYFGKPSPKRLAEAVRYVLPPEQGGFRCNISLYGDKIALVTFEGKLHSVIIESKQFAQALRVLFSYAYETSKKKLSDL